VPSIKVQGRTVEELIGPISGPVACGFLALTLSSSSAFRSLFWRVLRRNSSPLPEHGPGLVGLSPAKLRDGATFMIVFSLWSVVVAVAGWVIYKHLLMRRGAVAAERRGDRSAWHQAASSR